MGCFDTFIFQAPLFCPVCGAVHEDVQSKSHGSNMYTYRVGDVVTGSERYEIAQLEMYCGVGRGQEPRKCENLREKMFGNKYYPSTVYVLIEDHKFIGVAPTRNLAELIGALPDDVEDYYYYNY